MLGLARSGGRWDSLARVVSCEPCRVAMGWAKELEAVLRAAAAVCLGWRVGACGLACSDVQTGQLLLNRSRG